MASIVTKDSLPEQWTTDAREMDTEYYWGPEGVGTAVAASVGLSNPIGQMIMCKEYGGAGYVFTARGQGRAQDGCYLWSMVGNDVFEYTKPTDLKDILAEMRKPGGKGKLEMVEVVPPS